MYRRHIFHPKHVGTVVAVAMAGMLRATPVLSAVTDISAQPLASVANLNVLPNVFFILDDSGSMAFDGLPDVAENNQGGTERRFFHEEYQCKPRGTLTVSSTSALNGLPTNFCDRVDPPFGAVTMNGLYYNPSVTYRPPPHDDGTTLFPTYNNSGSALWTAVPCDPYYINNAKIGSSLTGAGKPYQSSSNYDCGKNGSGWYQVAAAGGYSFNDYYNNTDDGSNASGKPYSLSIQVTTKSGTTYEQNFNYASISSVGSVSNGVVAQWYGSGSTLDVTAKFPEIVYCNSTGASATDTTGTACRRNGTPINGGGTPAAWETGNTFRYTSAHWRTGYPEAPPINLFTRASTGSTVTVTTADAHGLYNGGSGITIPAGGFYLAFSTYQIIPRTGSGSSGAGFDTCSSVSPATSCITPVTITPSSTAPNQFTYSRNSGAAVAYSRYDLVVNFFRRKKSASDTTVYVTAPSHGLIVGDKINVYALSPNNGFASGTGQHIACSQGATQTITSVVDANHFTYTVSGCTWTGTNDATVPGFFQKTGLFNIPKLRTGTAFYYNLLPVEYCTDEGLTNCAAATAPTGAYTYPAQLRYCANPFDANRVDTPSGNDPLTGAARCKKKYFEFVAQDLTKDPPGPRAGYIYPRYGQFQRVDITSGTASYPRDSGRTDCGTGTTCTYAQEMTNFANWFAYYRHRMLMMKTSAGIAFQPIDTRFKVGFMTINAGAPPGTNDFLAIKKFDSTQKATWYDYLYSQTPGGGTPLQKALAKAGRYFAGKTDGNNKGMIDPANGRPDPVEYACQQNFALLTTDGYWSDPNSVGWGVDLSNNNLGDVDNASNLTRPYYDGNVNGKTPWDPDGTGTTFFSAGTLADVAQYYYQTDLRPSGSIGALGTDVSADIVPTTQTDTANWQHMVTFGLGMAEGLMNWRSDYASAKAGDYYNIAIGAPAGSCSWVNGQCNWPVPGGQQPANLDDLWHAAVNGRGQFFYAHDTQAVQSGLIGALTSLQARNASGAAAATSTPNITPADHYSFNTQYTTVSWNGDVLERLIDPNTGNLLPGYAWSAKLQLQAQTSTTSDTRTLYLFDNTTTTKVKSFDYTLMTAAEQTWFANRCNSASWSQCATLDYGTGSPTAPSVGSDLWTANQGANLVNFLRGQSGLEATIFRDRQFALGDTVNAVPLYVSKPHLAYADLTSVPYTTWADSLAGRKPVLYVGANDGMLHAFDVGNGNELWAYIPRIVAPNLWKLAEMNYASLHSFFVDGSPQTSDVWDGSAWRTILVGGLNSGGRGYYALDITNPASPQALWEFCSDSTLCPISDVNLGFTYGNPVITKRPTDGRWVVLVTSGYNNVSPGDGVGRLYVLDAITGAILQTISTGVGSTTTPSGFGKINVWSDNYTVDNTGTTVYGGDMLGNLFKIDLTSASPTALLLGKTFDASGRPQPITTKPEIALVQSTYRVLFVGTGRYLGTSDLTDAATQTPAGTSAWQQSLYAFKDTGTSLGNLRNASGMVHQIISSVSGSTTKRTISPSGTTVNWSTQTGWWVDFNLPDSPGERVNVDPQLVLGTLVINTNVPGGSACSIGGDSWAYQFDYLNGTYVSTSTNQLLGVKTTGSLTVGLVVYQLQKGSLIGQAQQSDTTQIQYSINTTPGATSHRRTSWRELSR